MTTPKKPRTRFAGILLHPTSLPGPFGIGDLGPAAFQWVDWLEQARQSLWQILPLGPTGFGDSPYQCFSAFAGNPFLVSPELLQRDGLLVADDLKHPDFPVHQIDFGPVIQFKLRLLGRAWERFKAGAASTLREPFEKFKREEAHWLDDYGLFRALKDANEGRSWLEWPVDQRLRQPAALERARTQLSDGIGLHKFRQFLFFRQWRELKKYANQHGLQLIGDAPIFVSSDSADVWANPKLFQLDAQCQPKVVAGVPPDYFSSTGQLWGNPLYDWEALKKTNYAWWEARVKATLQQVDIVRLDHFRGFEAYWEIPAGNPTAEIGRWVQAPGADLFETLRRKLGKLPVIAEDLGLITEEVEELRDKFQLPGMRILQFAFGDDATNRFLPHNYDTVNSVVYTGTHDNDTTVGWFNTRAQHEKDAVCHYLARDGHDIAWDLMRLAWMSVANYALAPLQDVLSFGTEARMNLPGRAAGNWGWRYTPDQIHECVQGRLREITERYNRA